MREGTLTITVLSKPNCQPCIATKRWLTKRDIEFTPLDVTESAEAYAEVKALGYDGVPVTVIRDTDGAVIDHWFGFIPDNLSKHTIEEKAAA